MRSRLFGLPVLALLLLALPCYAADHDPEPEVQNSPKHATAGLLYGWIHALDSFSLTIRPIDKGAPVRRFYLDPLTVYFVNGKQSTRQGLYEGDKVAVRFFADDRLAVADRVFVVFGEFNAVDYSDQPPKPKKTKKGPAKKGSAKKSASH